ncbi:hypothetical protein INR49_003844 [Caranx melampygus]|nr:hypothetical protein INR49_003844 [Caranx melampygus]
MMLRQSLSMLKQQLASTENYHENSADLRLTRWSQDATDLLHEDLVMVEQRVEPARKAAQVLYKKLQGCMQSQLGLEAEKRMKKLPLMLLSISMAESFKDFDAESSIRRVLEMCCFMEKMLAHMLADYEMKLEKEVLEPLNKLSEDQYSADLYHFATKEDDYANYFIRLLELQAEYHRNSHMFLEKHISELKENHSQKGPTLSVSNQKVYGEPLLSHLSRSDREIAAPIQECIHMLLRTAMEEEGLFRLAAAASVVKRLKTCLDQGTVDHSEFSMDPHAVAVSSLCLEFDLCLLREKDLTEKLEQFRVLLKKLPPENYNNLRYLVQFLSLLSEQQAVNKMTPSNIAIVLGPNLLWPRAEGVASQDSFLVKSGSVSRSHTSTWATPAAEPAAPAPQNTTSSITSSQNPSVPAPSASTACSSTVNQCPSPLPRATGSAPSQGQSRSPTQKQNSEQGQLEPILEAPPDSPRALVKMASPYKRDQVTVQFSKPKPPGPPRLQAPLPPTTAPAATDTKTQPTPPPRAQGTSSAGCGLLRPPQSSLRRESTYEIVAESISEPSLVSPHADPTSSPSQVWLCSSGWPSIRLNTSLMREGPRSKVKVSREVREGRESE